jgi:hypothetical protein
MFEQLRVGYYQLLKKDSEDRDSKLLCNVPRGVST